MGAGGLGGPRAAAVVVHLLRVVALDDELAALFPGVRIHRDVRSVRSVAVRALVAGVRALLRQRRQIAQLDGLAVRRSFAVDDIAGDEKSRALYEGVVKRDVKSIMYVGVTVGTELLGAFALSTTKRIRHWSEADIEVAKAAADQTGIAIRQARLYQKAEATSVREALVNKLVVAIRASLSLTSVLNTATRELGRALSASGVEVRLYNQNGDQSAARGRFDRPARSRAPRHRASPRHHRRARRRGRGRG